MIRKSNNFKILLFILLFWASPVLVLAVTPPIPPQPSLYVVDLAGVIDAIDRDRLEAMLKDLEDNYRVPVMILTLNSLDGEPIEDVSLKTALTWGREKKIKVNGVLIAVAVNDKKYRIEVGYALEATLPNSLVGRLGKQYLMSTLKKGDISTGIFSTTTEIVNQLLVGRKTAVKGNTSGASKKTTDLVKRLTGLNSGDISEMSSAIGIPFWVIVAVLFLMPVIITILWYRWGCPISPGSNPSTLDWLLWWRRNR